MQEVAPVDLPNKKAAARGEAGPGLLLLAFHGGHRAARNAQKIGSTLAECQKLAEEGVPLE